MSQFEGVIFDMDGVIVDSEPYHSQSFPEIWKEMGYEDCHGMHFPDFYGRSDRVLWETFIEKHHPPQPIEELLALREERLIQLLRDKQPIFNGVPELLQRLADRFPLAVGSGSAHSIINEVLSIRDLHLYFRCTVSSEDVEQPKPAPDIFLLAAKRLGVARNKCCVIEDTVSGVLAGKAAGMTVLGITNTFDAETLIQAGANYVFEDYFSIGNTILN